MKNITVSVPEEIYRKARVKAAERETSVSAEVSRFLAEFAAEESEFDRLEREMLEVINRPRKFGVRKRIPREKLHER